MLGISQVWSKAAVFEAVIHWFESSIPCQWKRGRVVYCTGLENRRLERVREFESHRFRHIKTL